MLLLFEMESEAVVQRCSIKTVFLEISQNSQESTCARVSFLMMLTLAHWHRTLAQVFSCEFGIISKNMFFHRTPLVAASHVMNIHCLRTT